MSVYAISDLHLAQSIDKPMDVFGGKWADYMDKISESWNKKVTEDDCIVIPGDISWATYLDEAVADFQFIENLPGKKIILKGNHDYWWTTKSKLDKFLEKNNFKTIEFLQNNCFETEKLMICGTRGWKSPGDEDFGEEDNKIYERELQRLELSLKSAKSDKDIVVAIHFPPFDSKWQPTGFIEIMEKYSVKICIYGHLHGDSYKNAFQGKLNEIEFKLVSSDFLKFEPLKLD